MSSISALLIRSMRATAAERMGSGFLKYCISWLIYLPAVTADVNRIFSCSVTIVFSHWQPSDWEYCAVSYFMYHTLSSYPLFKTLNASYKVMVMKPVCIYSQACRSLPAQHFINIFINFHKLYTLIYLYCFKYNDNTHICLSVCLCVRERGWKTQVAYKRSDAVVVLGGGKRLRKVFEVCFPVEICTFMCWRTCCITRLTVTPDSSRYMIANNVAKQSWSWRQRQTRGGVELVVAAGRTSNSVADQTLIRADRSSRYVHIQFHVYYFNIGCFIGPHIININ